jgi:hypothetical protein
MLKAKAARGESTGCATVHDMPTKKTTANRPAAKKTAAKKTTARKSTIKKASAKKSRRSA